MINAQQIKMARIGLNLTQDELARRVGLSHTGYWAIETGQSDPRTSITRKIQAVLEREGAVFSGDGSVRILPKSERLIVEPGQDPSEATLRAAAAIIAAGQKSREPRGGLG